MERSLPLAPCLRRLIINADDLGIGAGRDAGILELFACGAVSSASLLVDGASAADAARRATALGLPLGLHLNLSEGPLPAACSLTDDRGERLGKFSLRAALAAGRVVPDELTCEIRRQFERFVALTGGLPGHVDGHHHIHVEPAVAAALAPVMAREYGVYRVRLPREGGLDGLAADAEFEAGFQRAVTAAARQAEPLFAAHGIGSTQAFLGQSLMGTRLTAERIGAALAALAATSGDAALSVELMVHPGVPANAPGSDAFGRSPARAHEMAVLRSAAWQAATAGWQASSWQELPRPAATDDGRPTLLIYGKLTPATGNAETARRYAEAWAGAAQLRFRPVPAETAPLADEIVALRRFAAAERIDLACGIHLYRAGAPLAAAFATDDTATLPYGLLASGTDANADIAHPERAAAMARALAGADFLLCLNAEQPQRLRSLGQPPETTVLGNGIDVVTASRFSLRRALGLADDAPLILFPAALRRLKGVLPTVEALAPLLAGRFTGHVLVVLGPALEADYAAQLRDVIGALAARHPGLAGRIVLHDGLAHDDYLAALREAALLLNASEHEGLSHGLMEAMAAGVPVLARDIPGNRLLVRDGENGRLFVDFAALPAAYADCFDDGALTRRLAVQAQHDMAQAHPAAAERTALRDVLARCLGRRQVPLTLADGAQLRLDLAADTHPVSTENIALFRQLALSPGSRLPQQLGLVADIGCGCGVFGLLLLDAIARSGRCAEHLLFADPHRPSLLALERTLIRHGAQLPAVARATLSDGGLLAPLLEKGDKAALICANLPQTPGAQAFRVDRHGGSDGADLLCALIAQLPTALAAGGEAFLLHIGLAHPARVARTIADHGLLATVLAEQSRTVALADYEALSPGLAAYLLQEQAAGRAEFEQLSDARGAAIVFAARLLRLTRKA